LRLEQTPQTPIPLTWKKTRLMIMPNKYLRTILPLFFTTSFLLASCSNEKHDATHEDNHHEINTIEKGIHNGRLLHDNDFTLELAIFETGVPPEYRAWAYVNKKPIAVSEINLTVTLTRLGNKIDTIRFTPENGYLRGDSLIYEPHSFVVSIEATHNGIPHRWSYESFEGRTRIDADTVKALGINTEIAGPARLRESIEAYGHIIPDPERHRDIHARFDGTISAVHIQAGEQVRAGQALFTIESNESLKPYTLYAAIAGQIIDLQGMSGEQTAGQLLARLVDNTTVMADIAIFPTQLHKVKPGSAVTVYYQDKRINTTIDYIANAANANQSVNARVRLPIRIPLGASIKADITVAEYDVPLAVKREGLQGFRDFTVVYAQVGDEFEVRMLDLGRTAGEWVEVLGGLDVGTRYVTANSFVIKADIEKSAASHDH